MALGAEAREAAEGFQWDKQGRYWWVAVANVVRWVTLDGGAELDEEDVTDEMLSEIVRNTDAGDI